MSSHQAQYVSGLWLPDIHHGLLWQSMLASPRICGCGAPLWSWLSFAGPVSWFPGSQSATKMCEVLSVVREEHTDPELYLINQAVGLQLKSKLQPDLALGCMPNDVDDDVTYISGHRPCTLVESDAIFQLCSHRVLISLVLLPAVAAGWGNFDRPDLLRSNRGKESEEYMTLALCIALREQEKEGSRDGPKGIMRHNVADVLFLEPIEEAEGRFRRVGVGSIFDPDTLQCFEKSEDMELFLF